MFISVTGVSSDRVFRKAPRPRKAGRCPTRGRAATAQPASRTSSQSTTRGCGGRWLRTRTRLGRITQRGAVTREAHSEVTLVRSLARPTTQPPARASSAVCEAPRRCPRACGGCRGPSSRGRRRRDVPRLVSQAGAWWHARLWHRVQALRPVTKSGCAAIMMARTPRAGR